MVPLKQIHCIVCHNLLVMDEVKENNTLVKRHCNNCGQHFELKYESGGVSYIKHIDDKGESAKDNFGFSYECPRCGSGGRVFTGLGTPKTGWKCLACGETIPFDHIIPIGGYELKMPVYAGPPSGGRVRARRSSSIPRGTGAGYQAVPRASKPLPAGAVALSTLAGEMKVEPKKLRGWLRKVGFRKAEEHGSGWTFTKEESEEVKRNYGK